MNHHSQFPFKLDYGCCHQMLGLGNWNMVDDLYVQEKRLSLDSMHELIFVYSARILQCGFGYCPHLEGAVIFVYSTWH